MHWTQIGWTSKFCLGFILVYFTGIETWNCFSLNILELFWIENVFRHNYRNKLNEPINILHTLSYTYNNTYTLSHTNKNLLSIRYSLLFIYNTVRLWYDGSIRHSFGKRDFPQQCVQTGIKFSSMLSAGLRWTLLLYLPH